MEDTALVVRKALSIAQEDRAPERVRQMKMEDTALEEGKALSIDQEDRAPEPMKEAF